MERRKASIGLIGALGLALGGLMAGGCDRTDDTAGGPVVLQFWNGFSGPDGATMEDIVRDFNASQNEVRVSMQIIPWGTYYDKLTLGLAFGGSPDVFIMHAPRLAEYASQDVLFEFDDETLARAGFDVSDFIEGPWTASQFEGRQVGIPLDCHPIGLYYNLDLFEQAGIKNPPTTYEEFIETARRLTKDLDGDGTIDQWGFAFTWLHSNGITFLNQHGTAFLTDDLSRCGIHTPEGQAALQQMVDIWKKERVAPRPEGQDAWLGFLTGRVAMALEGVYMKSGLDNQQGLRYAAAPAPQFGPVRAVWGGAHVLCLPRGLEGRRLDAALKFVRYLSDHSLAWAKGGQLPVRTSILESEEFKALPVQSQFAKQLDYVVFEPPSVKLNQLTTFGTATIEAAINELLPVEEATAQCARRMGNVLARGDRP